ATEPEALGPGLVLQLVVVEPRETAGIHGAGVVDEDVDAAELLLRGFDQPLDVGLLRHVGLHGVDLAAGLLRQLVTRRVDLLGRAPGDHDAHAFLEEHARGFVADAAAAARHDCAAALDAEIHFASSRLA